MWDLLPGPGIEPMCPALAGRFLTTAPPGKSQGTVIFSSYPPAKISVLSCPILGAWEAHGGSHELLCCSEFHFSTPTWHQGSPACPTGGAGDPGDCLEPVCCYLCWLRGWVLVTSAHFESLGTPLEMWSWGGVRSRTSLQGPPLLPSTILTP